MFTTKQYRDKAAEYQVRRDTAITPAEKREYQALEQRFTTLADNEQWLSDNYNKTVHSHLGSLPQLFASGPARRHA
jgi:hypothetical protein